MAGCMGCYLNLCVTFWEILTLMENWFYRFEVVRSGSKAKPRYPSGGAGCLIMCLWLEREWGGVGWGLREGAGSGGWGGPGRGSYVFGERMRAGLFWWVLGRCGGMWEIDCFLRRLRGVAGQWEAWWRSGELWPW